MKLYLLVRWKLIRFAILLLASLIGLLVYTRVLALPSLDYDFAGGIAVNGQAHQKSATVSLADTVDVAGRITVYPDDVGETADIFVYAEATLTPSPKVQYFMLDRHSTVLTWDKKPENLVAFQHNVTLEETQSVLMYSGNFIYPGTLKVFFGYQLANGIVVVNEHPIDITIVTSNPLTESPPHEPDNVPNVSDVLIIPHVPIDVGVTDSDSLGESDSHNLDNIPVNVETTDTNNNSPILKTETLSSGWYHSCAIKIDGDITCWGNNDSGQAPQNRSGPFIQVSVGFYHTCGLRANGAVDCWGKDDNGQTDVPSGTFIQVSAGNSHTCGIRTDGTIDCWGEGGEEGYSGYGEKIQPPTGTFIQLSAGFGDTCGIRTDHTMSCWGWIDGKNGNAKYRINEYAGNFTQVAFDSSHNCMLTVDGSMICWGAPYSTEGKFTQISVGLLESCGVHTDGVIECWYGNSIGTFSGTFSQVSVGREYACGVRTNGSVQCSGIEYDGDDYGQTIPPDGLVVAQPKPIGQDTSDSDIGSAGTNDKDEPISTNQIPVVDYYASVGSGVAPLTVDFDASPSYDPDGFIVDYSWAINGYTLIGKTVSFTFDKPSNHPYSVTLTVTDNEGATNNRIYAITVN